MAVGSDPDWAPKVASLEQDLQSSSRASQAWWAVSFPA